MWWCASYVFVTFLLWCDITLCTWHDWMHIASALRHGGIGLQQPGCAFELLRPDEPWEWRWCYWSTKADRGGLPITLESSQNWPNISGSEVDCANCVRSMHWTFAPWSSLSHGSSEACVSTPSQTGTLFLCIHSTLLFSSSMMAQWVSTIGKEVDNHL